MTIFLTIFFELLHISVVLKIKILENHTPPMSKRLSSQSYIYPFFGLNPSQPPFLIRALLKEEPRPIKKRKWVTLLPLRRFVLLKPFLLLQQFENVNYSILGGFQFKFVSLSRIINHMTCCTHFSALIIGKFTLKNYFARLSLQSECCNFNQ